MNQFSQGMVLNRIGKFLVREAISRLIKAKEFEHHQIPILWSYALKTELQGAH